MAVTTATGETMTDELAVTTVPGETAADDLAVTTAAAETAAQALESSSYITTGQLKEMDYVTMA